MAKILVADDNSNVQKTVALALVELGVEVVSVNNGEAAVRKLADVSPDLVLADIFMPVRNGYEVCEYIKKDSRFSHVPVVLLVGAFDPLDEREAQRVGADGILKKPFVPPDPLITMVKTLLDRTLGERLVAVAASKAKVAMQGKAGGVATMEELPRAPETSEELPREEFRPPVDRVSFGEGERPVAFGQLLETPAKESAASGTGEIEPVDDEQILTSSRDASLGDPIFWKTEEPQQETQEENSETEGEISSSLPMRPWKPDEEARPPEADFLQPVEPFELVREEKDQEAGQTSTIVESSPLIVQDAASQASLTVEAGKPDDLAANPIEWMASVPPPLTEETPGAAPEWSAEVAATTDNLDINNADNSEIVPESPAAESPVETVPPVSNSAPELPSTPSPVSIATHAQPTLNPLAQSAEDTARSIPKQDWADLTANLEPKSIGSIAERTKSSPGPGAQPNSEVPVLKSLAQSAEDTARSIPKQDWADLTANLQAKPIEPVAEKLSPAPAPDVQAPAMPAIAAQIPAATTANSQAALAAAPPASPDPALVEAVVQRVLDKMRPQVVDIITREFLRPVVQALVSREIQKR